MKYKYRGNRARRFELILNPGDELVISHKKTEYLINRSPNFEVVEEKKPKRKVKSNGSDTSGNSKQSTEASGAVSVRTDSDLGAK